MITYLFEIFLYIQFKNTFNFSFKVPSERFFKDIQNRSYFWKYVVLRITTTYWWDTLYNFCREPDHEEEQKTNT